MANPIAYNSGTTVSGCINKGTISFAVDNLNYSTRPGNLNWYAGGDNTNKYIIISDTYSQGVDTQANSRPTMWATSAQTDSELLKWINGLPARSGQSTFSTLLDAISWLEGQGKYLISNQHYPQIVTSGMVLNMNAGFTASYPNVGTTWYDLTNTKNGVLTNGPTWVNSGTTSYFDFDGSNDKVIFNANNFPQTYTKTAFFYARDTSSRNILSSSAPVDHAFWLSGNLSAGHNGSYTQVSTTISINRWYFGVVTYSNVTNNMELFLNGVSKSTNTAGTLGSGGDYKIGEHSSGQSFNGLIPLVNLYNRVLSQSEILQNYYQGPIVTSGLTFAIDAGNLVSYGGVGTTVYDLTATSATGTLTNGPTWTYLSGGTFSFDGVDDFISLPNVGVSNLSAFSVSFWAKTTTKKLASTVYSEGTPSSWPSNLFVIYFGNDENDGKCRVWFGYPTVSSPLIGTTNVADGRWYYVTYNQTSTSNRSLYVNAILESNNTTNITGHSVTNAYIGANNNNGTMVQFGNNNVSQLICYNRALSSNEINQNFEAYRGRFGV
jgi:hypothetical protein